MKIFFLILLIHFILSTKNVFHIIPHSHCDAGFVKTFEKYYEEEVRFIIHSVTNQLYNNTNLRFSWAEIGYLHKYWTDPRTTEEMKNKFKKIVSNNQMVRN